MKQIAALIMIALASHAGAQVAKNTMLNLNGFIPTLVIDATNPPVFASGVQPWWDNTGTPYLAPMPYTVAPGSVPLYQGLPGNGAGGATLTGQIPQASPAYPTPLWSSYANEAEAYPNADMALDMCAAGQGASPIAYGGGVIALFATPILSSQAATLPLDLAGRLYVSGAFNTYPMAQLYGYFEATLQAAQGDGFWSAFWMVPENMNASGDTEIDVTEILGRAPSTSNSTIHTTDVNSPSFPSRGVGYSTSKLSAAFHRYGVDWEPNWITFYFDGHAMYSTPTPADMHQPMYIIVNLAVGTSNTWAGAPDSTTKFPGTMNIEAIRAWASPSTPQPTATRR
jgi:hypothetical protein